MPSTRTWRSSSAPARQPPSATRWKTHASSRRGRSSAARSPASSPPAPSPRTASSTRTSTPTSPQWRAWASPCSTSPRASSPWSRSPRARSWTTPLPATDPRSSCSPSPTTTLPQPSHPPQLSTPPTPMPGRSAWTRRARSCCATSTSPRWTASASRGSLT